MQVKERRPKGGLGWSIFRTIPSLFRTHSAQAPISRGPAVAFVGLLNRLGWNAYQTRKEAMFRYFSGCSSCPGGSRQES
jgi:hypothetical protein